MSTERHVVRCGGVSARTKSGDNRIDLNLTGPDENVTLRVSDVSRAFSALLPEVLVDLLEIAAYVYAADQAALRGSHFDEGQRWRRCFKYHVPVRALDVWNAEDVKWALEDALSFLSDDEYEFTFTKMARPPPAQLYFPGAQQPLDVDEVILFSGGLDSLAGAIHELQQERDVALVSHSSASKRTVLAQKLVDELRKRNKGRKIRHIPVVATKAEGVGGEYTQRTRSFLYASLATAVARMAGKDRIRFYENGVTSMNLPVAAQVVAGRATRTTHPQTLEKLSVLFMRTSWSLEDAFATRAE